MKKIRAGLLYTICRNIPDAVYMIDMDWTILSWNKGAEDMLGYKEDELSGKSIAVTIPEEMAQKEIEHCINELNTKGKMPAYETKRLSKDGRIVPVELTAVLLKEAGRNVGYAAIMRDIGDRKRIESALNRSGAILRTIFNSSNEAIFVHDTDSGQILEVNEKFFELYGYGPEDLPDLTVGSLSANTPGYTNSDALKFLKRASAGEPQSFEWMARKKSGELFWVEVHLRRAVIDEQPRILAMCRDITGQKQSEDALKLTQFLVDHAAISAFLIARNASILYANDQACHVLGYSREELLTMSIPDIDPAYPHAAWDSHWEQLKSEGSLKFETLHRRKDGTLVPMEISLNYFSFGGQEFNVAFGLDIRERKKAEEEIARINRQRVLILESAGDGIFGMDVMGNHIFVNSAGKGMLGYGDSDLINRNSHSIWHHTRADGSLYPANECLIYKTRTDGISRHVDDEVFWKKDGSSVPVEYTTTPIFEGNAIVGTVVTFRDITERKRMEKDLLRAYEKLEMKVKERTRELAASNKALQLEVKERRSAIKTIRRSKKMSDALNRLAAVIHSTLDFDKVMQRVVKEAAIAMEVDAAMIGIFQNDIFNLRYSYNLPKGFTDRKLTSNELRAVYHVALAGDAVAFNDAFNDERLNRNFTREMGIRSLLSAPLFVKQKVAGIISFYRLSSRILFEEMQKHLTTETRRHRGEK